MLLKKVREHLTFFVKNEVLSAVTLLRHNISGFARVLSFLAFMDKCDFVLDKLYRCFILCSLNMRASISKLRIYTCEEILFIFFTILCGNRKK